VKKIAVLIPGSFVIRNDPKYIQGLPDIIVLYKNMWAALEVKISAKARIQPNQQHYIDTFGAMAFASFINPDNEGEVLSELQRSFGIGR
jgi:phenolic acid decarboxylase